MNIALIAHDAKKKLMQNFCIAYRGILSKNELYATGTTGRLIEEVTNLNIHKCLAGHLGGEQQIGAQIENNEMEKAHNNIMKTQRIIEEFRNTLDRQYEVAEDFDRIYVYVLRRLFEANVRKDKEILEEVNGHLRSLRDTWKEVMKKCNKA